MKSLDFGKWNYLLNKIDYNNYEHIVFINDSFIIKGSINHFFNLIYKNNVELYGRIVIFKNYPRESKPRSNYLKLIILTILAASKG